MKVGNISEVEASIWRIKMNNEYITKQQAIDLANRLQAFIGLAGASVYGKEAQRMEEGIVRCDNCKWQRDCKFAQKLGINGFCSEGERIEFGGEKC
jgi:hypothetical protein